MRISDICKERRTELKLSNIVISEQSGINLQTVNNFFSQSKAPSIYTVGPICRVLGVSLDEVFEIISPSMGQEEIDRIKEQTEFNEAEFLKYQEEAEQAKADALHKIEIQANEIKHLEEVKARQDARIKSQVKAIFWLRCLIALFAALFIVFVII